MKNNTKSSDFFGLHLSVGDLVAPARVVGIRSDIDYVVVSLLGPYIIVRPSFSSVPNSRHYLSSDFVKLIG